MNYPWLTTIGAVPLVGSAAIALLPRSFAPRARHVALGVSLATFVLTVIAALQFDRSSSDIQLYERHQWIPEFGVSYAVGVNGIGLVMVALSAVLVPVCV